MKQPRYPLMAAWAGLVAVLGLTGCGGFAASPSVSPLSLLLPGLVEHSTSPTSPTNLTNLTSLTDSDFQPQYTSK